MLSESVIAWLLDSDPALRWQVQRDILGEPQEVWQATRARTATEGFGARLLALQDPDGQWAGGAFFPPADFDFETISDVGQPWTATTWSLNALREWGGVDADVLRERRTPELLAAHCRWEYDDLPTGTVRSTAASTPGHSPTALARRRRHRHQGLVSRAPTGRRRLELRVGRRLDPFVISFDAERAEGPAGLRSRHR